MKRLLDGQFDECDLTMRDLERIERSLAKTCRGSTTGASRIPRPRPWPRARTKPNRRPRFRVPDKLDMPSRRFTLTIHAGAGKLYLPFLRKRLRTAARLLPAALRELSIVLVNDRVMADLHIRFMNIPGPTDVLTFPMDEDRAARSSICVPEARRRAKEHGTMLRDELLLYAIHGMLHLCGMDDRTKKGFDAMHRIEDRHSDAK